MTAGTRIGPWVAVVVLIMGFVLFALAGLYTFNQQRRVNEQLCKQTLENREATRRTWLSAQEYILRSTPDQEAADRTRKFFRAVLMTIPPLECVDRKPVEVSNG